jgi:hypothetical protein
MGAIEGPAIPGFPKLTEMIHGMVGLIVIIGKTEIGKSHLATQLAVAVAGPDFPVVICDLENRRGTRSMSQGRANRMYGPKHPGLRYTWDVPTFEIGVKQLREQEGNEQTGRGLLVLDTLQASLGLPGEGADTGERAVAGERRMRECEALVAEGYTVLVTSQVGRTAQTGRPSITSAKWSSAIEQTAWTVLSYWAAPGSPSDRLLAPEKLRQEPEDSSLRKATLLMTSDQNRRVTESLLGSRGELGRPTPVRDLPVTKIVRKRGPMIFTELVKALHPKSRATAARWIAQAVTAGQLAAPDETRNTYAVAGSVSNLVSR